MKTKHEIKAGERENRGLSVTTGLPEADAPLVDFTASDETLDRYGEVISAAGWDLRNYARNPVFLNAHQSSDITHVLGRAEVTEVRDGRLYQRIRFAVEENPIARLAHGLYRGGYLRAVSVGFVPHDWVDGGEGDGFTRMFTKQELLEVSAVPIPANPSALAMGLGSGAVSRGDVDDTIALLETLKATKNLLVKEKTEQPIGLVRAPADDAMCARLLNVLREIAVLARGGK